VNSSNDDSNDNGNDDSKIKYHYHYKDYLLKDANFKRWYENTKRGSPAAADERLRRIGLVCRTFDTTTQRVAKMKPKDATAFLMDIVSYFESKNHAPSYVKNYVKAVKSWLEFNGITVNQRIRVSNSDKSIKYADERPPTQEELKRIFNAADLREKTACALVSLSGLRPEVLGDYQGKDGLKVEDLPDMQIDMKEKTVQFAQMPAIVVIRPELSKAGHQYFTFLAEEGCQYLKEYLEMRIRKGEDIVAKSPIITPAAKNIAGNHIRTANIGDMIRQPIRRAGFSWRPYVLRRYFDTRMMLAESDALIIRDFRVFWMGHKGDIEHTYTVNKRLPDDVIEKMRESYAKAADKYLITTVQKDTMSKDMLISTFNKQFLLLSGYTEEEIAQLQSQLGNGSGDLSKLTPEDIQQLMKRKSMQSLGLMGGNTQKVIPMPEVKQWIVQGWEYVTSLPSNEAVVRLPG
jgi:hypothetical protein